MYNIGRDTYTCDICGFEEKWDAHDDHRGDMWECEDCGSHFCTNCFVKKCGQEEFDRMLRETDGVYCPDCYGKVMIREQMISEEEMSCAYSFSKQFRHLSFDEIEKIVDLCGGNFDTETVRKAIGDVVGFSEVEDEM